VCVPRLGTRAECLPPLGGGFNNPAMAQALRGAARPGVEHRSDSPRKRRVQKGLKNPAPCSVPIPCNGDAAGLYEGIGSPTSSGGAEMTATLCPQPRRAYPPHSRSVPTPLVVEDPAGLCLPGFSEDDAGNELRELLSSGGTSMHGMGTKMDASLMSESLDGAHIGERRPLSAISTSAGATPSPEGRTSPHPWPPTPDSQRPVGSPAGGGGASSALAGGCSSNKKPAGPRASCPRRRPGFKASAAAPGEAGGSEMSGCGGAPRQPGKVFVGGVPQDMNQDDLYNVFNEFGGVKKAWLQSYRTIGRINQAPPHNHRGFGFVIFYDICSVDQLLEKNYSRFLALTDGRRLEVKRAVPSSELPGKPSPLVSSSSAPRVPSSSISGKVTGKYTAENVASTTPWSYVAPSGSSISQMSTNSRGQGMKLPHSMHAQSLTSPPGSMIMAPVPYPYGGFAAQPLTAPVFQQALQQGVSQQALPHQQQHNHHLALQQQGLAGFPVMQGMQVLGPHHHHGAVQQHSNLFHHQPQPRMM